jgi:tetratricopeptide (TPR) repeat protein
MSTLAQTAARTERPDAARLLGRPAVLLILIAAATFLLYLGTLRFEFVWDDFPQIVDNPLLRSWHELPRVFTTDLWFHTGRDQVYYRPLFVIWSMVNYALFGLKPWAWHLTAVLLHAVTTVSIFFLARKLRQDNATALLASLLYGVHPIHIEVTAWISAASDTMVTLFYVLAFIAFINSRDSRRWLPWRVGSFLLFACALLTKEMAVTFAAMIGVYVLLFPRPDESNPWLRLRRAILIALPYVLMTAAYFALRSYALRSSISVDHGRTLQALLTLPLVLTFYLKKLFLPSGLTALYDTPYLTRPTFLNFFIPVLLLAAACALVTYWTHRRHDRVPLFMWLWIFIGLVPVLYLPAFTAGDFVRDRYVCLSSVGFVLLLACAIRLVTKLPLPRAGVLHLLIVLLVCGALAASCWAQQAFWASDVMVFYRGYSLYPNDFNKLNLALALLKRGETAPATKLLTEITQQQNGGVASYYLAQAYIAQGRKAEAAQALETGLRTAPTFPSSPERMATVGFLLTQVGQYDRAISLYDRALSLEPDLYTANLGLGYTYFTMDRDTHAERFLKRAAAIAPGVAAPELYLGQIGLRTQRLSEAETHLHRALAADPNAAGLHYWLGRVFEAEGKPDEARQEYRNELKVHPDFREASARLALLDQTWQK